MRYIILHGHIFKNAGTTFDWSLQRNFGDNFLDHRQDQLMRTQGGDHLLQLLADHPDLQAVSSHHMTRNLPDTSAAKFLQVCMLRHPIERIRSVYDFERKQRGRTPGSKAAKSKSFRDYVAWRMTPAVAHTIRNYQTLYLAGYHGLAGDSELAGSYFPRASKSVGEDTLVGVVDRYDESMVVLEESLRQYFPELDLAYVPQNVARGKRRKSSADQVVAQTLGELGDLQKQVIDNNSYDLALYQLAVSNLESRISGIEDFAAKLSSFRERCQRLRPRILASF
jgi:hypothetical protein